MRRPIARTGACTAGPTVAVGGNAASAVDAPTWLFLFWRGGGPAPGRSDGSRAHCAHTRHLLFRHCAAAA